MTAYIYASADLQWFEAPENTALGQEITQGDQDCRRAYRRLNAQWWAWLHRMHTGFPMHDQIRRRLVELRGEDAVAKAEAIAPTYDYFPPLPRFPHPQPNAMEMKCT